MTLRMMLHLSKGTNPVFYFFVFGNLVVEYSILPKLRILKSLLRIPSKPENLVFHGFSIVNH